MHGKIIHDKYKCQIIYTCFFNWCTKLHEGSNVPTFLTIHEVCDDLKDEIQQPQTEK